MPSRNEQTQLHEQLHLAIAREKVHSAVSACFEETNRLQPALEQSLEWLIQSSSSNCGEIWVVNEEGSAIHLVHTLALDSNAQRFYRESSRITRFKQGEGVPGRIWASRRNACWNDIDQDPLFIRHQAAFNTSMKAAFGVPLMQHDQVVGVLLLLADTNFDSDALEIRGMRDLGSLLGTEIRRRQQEEQMYLLFESSPDIMGIASQDGYFRKVNPAFSKLLGYTEGEICSRPFHEFLHPDDRERTLLEFDETKTGSRQAQGFINRYVTKSGEIRYISWGSSDAFGLDRYVFSYGRDVTEQVRHEQSLVELNHQLKLSNEELEQFAFIASHDLQEPLRMISSFMALLEKRYGDHLDESAREYIQYAVDGAKRMRTLLLDLLEFSRSGTTQESFETLSLDALVEVTKRTLRREMEKKGATLHYDSLPEVYATRGPLLQILQNLVGNAMKYSREGLPPNIRIDAENNQESWTLRVRDNGIGIEPEYHDKIFTLFQRLHQRNEYEGTGIGLAIVKKIVDRYNGSIEVESTPGSGSTFILTFPNRSKYPTA